MAELNRKQVLAIAVMIVLLGQISGCWSRQEIERLAFITMAGIDLGQTPDKVRLTAHIAKPSAIAGQSGGQTQERQVSIFSSEGATIAAASAVLAEELPRRITWAHNTVVAIGEEYARTGIEGLIDFITRTESARETVAVVVVKGATAWDLMQAQFALDQIPAEAIMSMIQNATRTTSASVLTTVNDARRLLETQGREMALAGIEVTTDPQSSPDLTGKLQHDTMLSTASMAGTAIFRGDRLVGWFDEIQSRGLQWILGNVPNSVLPVPHPSRPEATVSLRAQSSRSSISTTLSDANPQVSIAVKVLGSIGDSEAALDSSDSDVRTTLEHSLEEAVLSEIISAIDTGARQLRSDVFGFGLMMYRSDPRQWERLNGRWSTLIQQISVDIEVVASLFQTGFLVRGD